MNHFTTFSQYEYVRPDFENAKELIRKSVDKIKNAGTKEAVSKVFKAVNDQQRHLRTMATVAEIRNTIDTTDPFMNLKCNAFMKICRLSILKCRKFQKTVLQSEYLDALKDEYGELYFIRMERLMKLVSKENVENQVEESNLVQLYHKTAAKPVAQFKGEELNFMDC